MRRSLRTLCAVMLVATMPCAALAQRGGAAPRAPAPARRPVAPVARPVAPVARPAAPVQAPRSVAVPGGFNLNRDVNARPVPVQPRVLPQPVQRRVPVPQQRVPVPQQRVTLPPQVRREPVAPLVTPGYGPYERRFHGPSLRNPREPGTPWVWNHNVPWAPAPIYWGGGFWGPWAIAGLSSAVYFGSLYYDNYLYPSYEVEPESPGAILLQDYGLEQTPCGPPDLVVIWGPDNSMICALPNNLVGPGNYELDPATMTLISESP